MADMAGLEKFDASGIYFRRVHAIEFLIRQTDCEFIFLLAGGTAHMSRRDCEFREPTLRRAPTARREEFTGQFEGEPERVSNDET